MSLLSPASRPTKYLSSAAPKTQTNVHALITPAINHSLYLANAFRALLSAITITMILRSSLLYQYTRHVGLFLYSRSRYTSLIVAHHTGRALKILWKRTEKTRDRLFFEFMVFVLGGGNGVLLFLFWPGWIVVGLGLFMVWTYGS